MAQAAPTFLLATARQVSSSFHRRMGLLKTMPTVVVISIARHGKLVILTLNRWGGVDGSQLSKQAEGSARARATGADC